MVVHNNISTSPLDKGRWMTPDILASTATERTRTFEANKTAHEGTYPSSDGEPVTSDNKVDHFASVLKEARNPRAYRFTKVVNRRPEYRPAQRLELLRPTTDEGRGDPAERSILEGRRLYLGNLAYSAEPEEIEAFIRDNLSGEDVTGAGVGNGVAGGYLGMHISVDEFTGRNPSYCFLEFEDSVSARRACELLGGKMLRGRKTKCSLGQPKGGTLAGRRSGERSGAAFRRWGDFVPGDAFAPQHVLDGDEEEGEQVSRAGARSPARGGRKGPQGPNQTLAYYRSRG